MKLTIMSFNLRFNNPADGENAWPHRTEAAASLIAQNAPALIGLQEAHGSMIVDLVRRLPHYRRVGRGRLGGLSGQDEEHCAILYRTDQVLLAAEGQFWLSEQPDQPGSISWGSACPRICTWGRFELTQHPGRQFLLYNTHLDHVSQEARERGAALVLQALERDREASGLPAILTGDLNTPPGNPVIQFLRAVLADAYLQPGADYGATFHAFTGHPEGDPIDYLFATPEFRLGPAQIHREPIGAKYPSDHFPVSAVVEL